MIKLVHHLYPDGKYWMELCDYDEVLQRWITKTFGPHQEVRKYMHDNKYAPYQQETIEH